MTPFFPAETSDAGTLSRRPYQEEERAAARPRDSARQEGPRGAAGEGAAVPPGGPHHVSAAAGKIPEADRAEGTAQMRRAAQQVRGKEDGGMGGWGDGSELWKGHPWVA